MVGSRYFWREAGFLAEQLLKERLFMPCPFYKLTGLYCPGCGGTRAVKFFLQGRLLTSFRFHPLVLYGVLAFGAEFLLFLTRQITGKDKTYWRYEKELAYGAVAVVIVNFFVKNSLLIGWGIDLLKAF